MSTIHIVETVALIPTPSSYGETPGENQNYDRRAGRK